MAALLVYIPYQASFEEQRLRLLDTVTVQASLIDAIARYQRDEAATLVQVRDAHDDTPGFGKTGEFVLGKQEGDRIVFLLQQKAEAVPIPIDSELGAPMRRALRGETGSMVGLDYRGAEVLAAYVPLKAGYGAVAKIDMKEVRAPFLRSAGIAALITLLGVVAGIWAFRRETSPLLGRLEQEEARHRAVVETAVDGILTIDRRGIIQSYNRAAERMFGYTADEVIGRNVSMLMPSPYREEHDGYLERYLTTGEKRIIGIGRQVEAMTKDGTVFPIELAVSEVIPKKLFTGIIRDVTARVELIRELEQKNAELERFTYTVSHDLKSPLITISGFLGGIESDARAGNYERMSKDIARISGAAERMKLLLDELLELSRIGRIVNAPVSVPLGELVREVVDSLSGPIRDRGVEVLIQEDLPTIRGDRVRLAEVIQNLIENAIKFLGDQEHPKIEVGSRLDGSTRVFFVRDNGVGIDATYHAKIFGLFDKLDPSSPGTGIGLALVKRIVELHGGKIWVESEGPGRGAVFCFTLATKGQR